MKRKYIHVVQYAFETMNLDGPSEKFLKKTASLIGYIVHRFNTLDGLLNSTICELLFSDYDTFGLQVVYRRSYSDKVDLLKRILLGHQHDLGKRLPIFDGLIYNLKKVGTLRNQVIHADWETAHEDGFTLCKLKIDRNGVQHEYTQFTEESLNDILKLIDYTCEMFDTYEEQKEELYRLEGPSLL
jgi:hypothetical protein